MNPQGLDSIIAAHPFFAGLSAPDLALIAGCATNLRCAAGELLSRAGEPADLFFVIRAGRVALELQPPGRAPVRFATLGEGEVLGWTWVIPPYRWSADARALEVTRLIQFDGACLRRKCDADPRLGYDLMRRFSRVLAARLDHLQLQLMDVYAHDA